MKTETSFRINIVKPFLERLRSSYFIPIQQAAFVGHPDFIGSIRGKAIAIELKSSGEGARAIQKYHLKMFENSGAISLVISPDNWDEMKQFLQSLAWG